jgi:hypothetical protein
MDLTRKREATQEWPIYISQGVVDSLDRLRESGLNDPARAANCAIAKIIGHALGVPGSARVMGQIVYVQFPDDDSWTRYFLDEAGRALVRAFDPNPDGTFDEIKANVFIRLLVPSPSQTLVSMRLARRDRRAEKYSDRAPKRTRARRHDVRDFSGRDLVG